MDKKRVLLKLSGEAFLGQDLIICPQVVGKVALQIQKLKEQDFKIVVVIGAGNIWRGANASKLGVERAQADYMGMLATIINSLALQDALEKIDVKTRVMSAIAVNEVCEPYIRRKALRHLEKGFVLILAGGTGSPYFSTDTAAALRAAELYLPTILMAKNGVDGVYDKDPKNNKDAKKYEKITYRKILKDHLEVIDLTAASMCAENKIEMLVFNMLDEKNIENIANGKKVGTKVSYK